MKAFCALLFTALPHRQRDGHGVDASWLWKLVCHHKLKLDYADKFQTKNMGNTFLPEQMTEVAVEKVVVEVIFNLVGYQILILFEIYCFKKSKKNKIWLSILWTFMNFHNFVEIWQLFVKIDNFMVFRFLIKFFNGLEISSVCKERRLGRQINDGITSWINR